MASVLVVAEIAEGKLKKTTHSAITFAQKAAQALGGSFSILAIGAGAKGAASELGGIGTQRSSQMVSATSTPCSRTICSSVPGTKYRASSKTP